MLVSTLNLLRMLFRRRSIVRSDRFNFVAIAFNGVESSNSRRTTISSGVNLPRQALVSCLKPRSIRLALLLASASTIASQSSWSRYGFSRKVNAPALNDSTAIRTSPKPVITMTGRSQFIAAISFKSCKPLIPSIRMSVIRQPYGSSTTDLRNCSALPNESTANPIL